MDCRADPTPVQEVAETPEDAVLGNEWATCLTPEKRVNGSMVIKK